MNKRRRFKAKRYRRRLWRARYLGLEGDTLSKRFAAWCLNPVGPLP
jgi:hypothetical protein